LNGDIIFPVQNNNLSNVLDMERMCEDDNSIPQDGNDRSQASLSGSDSVRDGSRWDGITLWSERNMFLILALSDLFQATLHLRSSIWDVMEEIKVTGYKTLILLLIAMYRNLLLHCISAKIQEYLDYTPKAKGIGLSNKARMGSLAAESVIENSKLSKGWIAVSLSRAKGNSHATEEQFKKGMQATFIEARNEDTMEFEEDHDHVVSAERDLLIKSENLDEF
jgi:hypothetical protein